MLNVLIQLYLITVANKNENIFPPQPRVLSALFDDEAEIYQASQHLFHKSMSCVFVVFKTL